MTKAAKKEVKTFVKNVGELEKKISELRAKVNTLSGNEFLEASTRGEALLEYLRLIDGADETLMHAEDCCNQAISYLQAALEA